MLAVYLFFDRCRCFFPTGSERVRLAINPFRSEPAATAIASSCRRHERFCSCWQFTYSLIAVDAFFRQALKGFASQLTLSDRSRRQQQLLVHVVGTKGFAHAGSLLIL